MQSYSMQRIPKPGRVGSFPTYSTTFPLTENPISESGVWLQHDTSDQTVVKTLNGNAYGTQSGGPRAPYDDSAAHMAGFGNDYEVEGILALPGGLDSTIREVELLLRWSTDNLEVIRNPTFGPTHSNGYEINMNHLGAYLDLGRFKGALLAEVLNFATPVDGDKYRARIEKQRIRVWFNDVLQIDFTDNDAALKITSGDPGIGFFVNPGVSNTDFGFSSVTIRSL